MITKEAHDQLRWRNRILFRKRENKKEAVKLDTLACVCLHNRCINLNVSFLNNRD